MGTLGLILLVFAFVFACIAAAFMVAAGRWHFGWTAFAFYIAAQLFGSLLH